MSSLRGFPLKLCTASGPRAVKAWYRRQFSTTEKYLNIHASLEVQNKIGIITLKSPGKVNVLNMDFAKAVEELFAELRQDPGIIGGVLISNKPDCFIAGADINLFSSQETIKRGRELSEYCQMLLESMEMTKKPVVAAVMGSCLGGGLEVALACHYRLVVDKMTTFGLPEVLLGLLPGAGGTQRLPKLIGLPNALDMILTGKTIRPKSAKEMGLIDQIVDPLGPGLPNGNFMTLENLSKIAVETSRKLAIGDLKIDRRPKGFIRKSTKIITKSKLVRNYIFDQAKKKVMQQTKGLYPAPLRALQVVNEGQNKGEKAGFKAEAKAFGELLGSQEAKNLISLFHGQTECKKNKFGKSSVNLSTIAIVGAGELGTGVANICVKNDFETLLNDSKPNVIKEAKEKIQNSIKTSVDRKSMTAKDGEERLSRFYISQDIEKFSKANFVIEAVGEDLELKQNVLREVEKVIPEHCVYASSTSSIVISNISKLSTRPEKVIGMHYSSPVDKMQLVEVVRTNVTSEEALQIAVDVALKQKKVPIVVTDSPGFYTYRVFTSMSVEALRLIIEGVNPERIDKLAMNLGFPKGPVALTDEMGTDVVYEAYKQFVKAFGERYVTISSDICDEIIKAGYLGKKCGKGHYTYSQRSSKKINQDLLEIIKNYNVQPKVHLSDENIQTRLVTRFVNEALLCLEEKVLSNPLEGDVGAVFGLGFPPVTGGPFHYVDSIGANNIVSDMRKLEEVYGSTFTPCQLLQSHAKDSNKKFFP